MAPDHPGLDPLGGVDPVRVIADSPLLRSAVRSSLDDLRPLLEWVVLEESDVLSLGGAHGNALYFVAEGRLDVLMATDDPGDDSNEDGRVVARITVGDVIGETQTLAGATRRLAVRAAGGARLVKLSKEGFDQYLITHPELTPKLKNIFTPRFYRRQMLLVLNDMFGELTPRMLADIERRVTWQHLAREGILIRRSESSDKLYAVVSGRLRVLSINDSGAEKVVEDISQGGTVGQLGLFSDDVPPTEVVALRDSVLLQFRHEDFRELATRYPRLNEWLVRLLSKRLGGVIRGGPAEEPSTNVLLVAAGYDASLDEFVRRFAEAMGREASSVVLTSTEVDRALGAKEISQAVEGSPEDLRLRVWLDQREVRFRYVIYLADPEVTNWTSRCIRQAEEIIFVGSATASPRLGDVELAIIGRERGRRVKPRQALVLQHPPGTDRPRDTKRWLSRRRVDRHFQIRVHDRRDIERLVRYVRHREIGLVLSGGGARGFAHAGVIRAIVEAGLPLDIIGAASMGALIGGRYALTRDADELVPLVFVRSVSMRSANARSIRTAPTSA